MEFLLTLKLLKKIIYFLQLKEKKNDGHNFAKEALKKEL